MRDRSTIFATKGLFVSGIAASIYFGLLYLVYVIELRRWDYLGFPLGDYTTAALLLSFVCTLAPLPLLTRSIERASGYFAWCIYYFVYVPALIYPVLQWFRTDVPILTITLCASFLLLLLAIRSRPAETAVRTFSANVFWTGFWMIYVILTGYTISVFGSHFSLADITNVYDQRAQAGELSEANLAGYATGMLSGCLNPFLMSIGLVYGRRGYLVAGIAGQVFVYATFAMKSILLSIIVIPIFYLLCLRGSRIRWYGVATITLGLILLPLLLGQFITDDESLFYENLSAIIYMRTFGMVGALTGVYYDFFSDNPQTFYSHVNIVRAVIPYPYEQSIGEVIGAYMGLGMNANANFFATDGLAAAGLFGTVLIGGMVGLMFRAVDSIVPQKNIQLLCCAAAPAMINISNSSFFTSVLTGGLLLLIAFCSIWNSEMGNRLPLPFSAYAGK